MRRSKSNLLLSRLRARQKDVLNLTMKTRIGSSFVPMIYYETSIFSRFLSRLPVMLDGAIHKTSAR
jgi:hypothetical protein